MPHFTLQLTAGGPVVDIVVGVSAARHQALTQAGQPVPPVILIRALVDTGASSTCLEPSVFQSLQLSPIGQVPTFTPTTGGTPHSSDQYDIGLVIPSSSSAAPFTRQNLLVLAAQPSSLHHQGIQGLIGRDTLEDCLLNYNGALGFFTLAY